MASAGARAKVVTRPKDRRAQIISHAAELFWRDGYDGVTVSDVASSVGIAASAVYRHVPGKEALLVEPIREMVMAWYASALVAVDGGHNPEERLARLISAVVMVAVDRPAVVGLWHREARHLPDDVRTELVAVRGRTVDLWSECLRDLEPTLPPDEAEFRIRAALGLLNSVALLTKAVSRTRTLAHYEVLMHEVIRSSRPAASLSCRGSGLDSSEGEDGPLDRREDLLRVGARLFRQRGYHRVGIDDIGEAAGIRGPSMYGYFASKSDVLNELLTRMADLLDEALSTAAGMEDPREAVERLAGEYVRLSLEHRDLLAVYVAELQHLPPERLALLLQRRQGRARRWTVLLVRTRPDLDDRAARITVLATLEMIFAVARSRRWTDDASLAARLEALALSALLGN
ncbi:MAG: regulatory protein TetR [Marmoricola sp.]|nr:regulatory protein TetR [Marmoricola sp.]